VGWQAKGGTACSPLSLSTNPATITRTRSVNPWLMGSCGGHGTPAEGSSNEPSPTVPAYARSDRIPGCGREGDVLA
jgi:hypothetical protein